MVLASQKGIPHLWNPKIRVQNTPPLDSILSHLNTVQSKLATYPSA